MQIYGHRGARGEAPENTLAGFSHLRQIGIHRVELDIVLDRNNEAIVIHDDTLDRTTNAQGPVKKFDALTLAQLDARGSDWQGRWPHITGVPTLEAVLDEWPQIESIQIEVKKMPIQQCGHAAKRILALCQQFQLNERGIITSQYIPFLQHLKSIHCKQAMGLVASRLKKDLVQEAVNLGCNYLCLKWTLCNPVLVQEAHQAGLSVSLWTVNDTTHLDKFYSWGVDSIITDYPSRFELAKKV